MGNIRITGDIAGICVGLILAAAMLPTALQQLATANTTGLSAAIVAIYGLIGILGCLAVGLGFLDMINHKE